MDWKDDMRALLERQLAAMTEQRDAARVESVTLHGVIDEWQALYTERNAEVAELKAKLDAANVQAGYLRERVRTLESMIDTMRAETMEP